MEELRRKAKRLKVGYIISIIAVLLMIAAVGYIAKTDKLPFIGNPYSTDGEPTIYKSSEILLK